MHISLSHRTWSLGVWCLLIGADCRYLLLHNLAGVPRYVVQTWIFTCTRAKACEQQHFSFERFSYSTYHGKQLQSKINDGFKIPQIARQLWSNQTSRLLPHPASCSRRLLSCSQPLSKADLLIAGNVAISLNRCEMSFFYGT